LVIEIARSGYKVLVAANNPIARFLIETGANPPSRDQLKQALAELAASRRGEDRMEPHILDLYNTRCDACSEIVSAKTFLWEREAKSPYARIYECPVCGQSGEFPVLSEDIERATAFASGGLHQARALARVAAIGDPVRGHVEEALTVYPPRAVYALFTIINKIDGLEVAESLRMHLAALLLSAFDQCNALWDHPTRRERPKQLVVSAIYRENNVWLALEQAVDDWILETSQVSLLEWPEQPSDEGGICLYEGRLKKLVKKLEMDDTFLRLGAVVTAFPRPNQAFWTLSALWAGWLWGKEAIGSFAGVLRRRRYDWAWHTTALCDTLSNLALCLDEDTPFFGMITESEPGFDLAVVLAATRAGFNLVGVTLRPDERQTQLLLRSKNDNDEIIRQGEKEETIREAAIDFLQAYGQPAKYLRMQAAALCGLSRGNLLSDLVQTPADDFSGLRSLLEASLSYQRGFKRYDRGQSSAESGYWWLREEEEVQVALIDRLEKALVSYLILHPGISFGELDAEMCRQFPGLLTPNKEMLTAILESYAEVHEREGCRIRTVDAPGSRRADLEEIRALLVSIGNRLGYQVYDNDPLLWIEGKDQIQSGFYMIASALLNEIILDAKVPTGRGFVVLPGGRANLILYKLRNNPFLDQVSKDWRFLKFRHIRRIHEIEGLTREMLEQQLNLDQLTYSEPQIPLL
jgi:hypothetical protein